MSKVEEEYYKLLREYRALKDRSLNYKQLKDWVYDAMLYYIEGFEIEIETEEEMLKEIKGLKKQVKAFKAVFDNLDKISFTYG